MTPGLNSYLKGYGIIFKQSSFATYQLVYSIVIVFSPWLSSCWVCCNNTLLKTLVISTCTVITKLKTHFSPKFWGFRKGKGQVCLKSNSLKALLNTVKYQILCFSQKLLSFAQICYARILRWFPLWKCILWYILSIISLEEIVISSIQFTASWIPFRPLIVEVKFYTGKIAPPHWNVSKIITQDLHVMHLPSV